MSTTTLATSDRRVPMTGLTRLVPQGTTWVDCEAIGLSHAWNLNTTFEVPGPGRVSYFGCDRCPVTRREVVA